MKSLSSPRSFGDKKPSPQADNSAAVAVWLRGCSFSCCRAPRGGSGNGHRTSAGFLLRKANETALGSPVGCRQNHQAWLFTEAAGAWTCGVLPSKQNPEMPGAFGCLRRAPSHLWLGAKPRSSDCLPTFLLLPTGNSASFPRAGISGVVFYHSGIAKLLPLVVPVKRETL